MSPLCSLAGKVQHSSTVSSSFLQGSYPSLDCHRKTLESFLFPHKTIDKWRFRSRKRDVFSPSCLRHRETDPQGRLDRVEEASGFASRLYPRRAPLPWEFHLWLWFMFVFLF